MTTEALGAASSDLVYIPSDEELLTFLQTRGVEVKYSRDGGLVECNVPTELIDHEEVPVKKEWAESLAHQMRKIAEVEGGSGQQQAIGLGLISGEPLLKIIDGFHRDAALAINQQPMVFATAKQTDWDKLYDQRIFTAKDHAHVRFSRVVQWIREVWKYSGLADKMTVEQAILLYRFETDGSKLGLEPDDVAHANEWVKIKEGQWDMAAMTIHSHLKIAENVDPLLVHSTREKKRGDVLDAPSQAIIKIFSQSLPGNFDLQNLVMDTAMQRNLKSAEVRALSIAVKDCQDADAASDIIRGMNWAQFEPAYRETKLKNMRRAHDPRHRGGGVLDKAATEVASVINRTLLIEERGEKIDDDMARMIQDAKLRAERLIVDLGRLSSRLEGLVEDRHSASTVKELTAYLSGRTDSPPARITRKNLREAWVQIDRMELKPIGWEAKFRDLQPQIERARQHERVDRELYK